MTDDSPSKQSNLKNEPKYDPGFVPAFRAGMNRLSKAEVKYLDSVITPEVAFLLTKAFGPDMGVVLWPLIAEDSFGDGPGGGRGTI